MNGNWSDACTGNTQVEPPARHEYVESDGGISVDELLNVGVFIGQPDLLPRTESSLLFL